MHRLSAQVANFPVDSYDSNKALALELCAKLPWDLGKGGKNNERGTVLLLFIFYHYFQHKLQYKNNHICICFHKHLQFLAKIPKQKHSFLSSPFHQTWEVALHKSLHCMLSVFTYFSIQVKE